MTEPSTYISLRDMYEVYPTPKRDPEDERQRLVIRPMESLARINHFVFAGRQSFGPGTRILTAGAGTGDETLYLAEQLRERGGELVYLDSSNAALMLCQRRAKMRRLENIEFHHGLIEDLDPDSFGQFDYIHCIDVLHQQEDPLLALQRLEAVLAPGGGLGLAVRAPKGISSDNAFRRLARILNPDAASLSQQHQEALSLLATLPPEHPFFHHRSRGAALREMATDPGLLLESLLTPDDAGLTVAGVHDLTTACGLSVIEFVPFDMAAPLFTLFYSPDFYVTDPKLHSLIDALSVRERREVAELLHGAMAVHGFYCGRPENREALPTDEEMTPSLMLAPSSFHIANNRLMISDYDGRPYEFEATPSIQLMFHLIDGVKTIGEIVAEGNRMLQQVGLPAVDLFATFLHLYSNLRNFGWVTLRHKSIDSFPRHDHLYYQAAGWIPPAGLAV